MQILGSHQMALQAGLRAVVLMFLVSLPSVAQTQGVWAQGIQGALLDTASGVSSRVPDAKTLGEGLAANEPGVDASEPAASTSARTAQVVGGENASRLDFFVGDSRWMPYGTVNGTRFSQLSEGFMGSITYYRDKNFGFELRGNTQIPSISETSTGGAVGIVYRFGVRFYPTVHANGGAQRFVGPNVPSFDGTGYYGNAPTWASTASFGASGEIFIPKTNGHLAIRFEANYEYFHCSYGPVVGPLNGGQVNVNSYNIDPGLVLRFGHAGSGGYRRSNY